MTVCFPEYHPDGKAGRYQLQTVVVVNHIIQHTTLSQQFSCWAEQWGFLKTGVPNPGDLVPDNLRWNWCNHDRNKTHNKCDVIESSPNHPPPPTPACGKHVFHKTGPSFQKCWGPLLKDWVRTIQRSVTLTCTLYLRSPRISPPNSNSQLSPI